MRFVVKYVRFHCRPFGFEHIGRVADYHVPFAGKIEREYVFLTENDVSSDTGCIFAGYLQSVGADVYGGYLRKFKSTGQGDGYTPRAGAAVEHAQVFS